MNGVQLKTLLGSLLLLGCRTGVEPTKAVAAGTRGLLDSLVAEATCPQPLPPITAVPEFLHPVETCALVQAAKRRLGREAANPPHWAPSDTGAIAGVGIYDMTFGIIDPKGRSPQDRAGVSVARYDSTLSLELDVPHRPRLIRVTYDRVTHQESFGVVHR